MAFDAPAFACRVWTDAFMQSRSDMCGLGQAQFDAMVEEGYQASLTWHQGAFYLAQSTLFEPSGISCLQAQGMNISMNKIMCSCLSS